MARRIGFLGSFVLVAAPLFWLGACGNDSDEFPIGPAPGSCQRGGESCPTLCDPGLGCVDCLTDDDCGAGQPFCVHGECTECSVNEDCGTGQSCFPENHDCQDACQDSGDCGGGAPICDPMTGQCLGCVDATDCDNEPICDPLTKQCVDCSTDEDCGVAQPFCDANGHCQECIFDGDCPAAEPLCIDHECHEAPTACTGNGDCGGDNPICDLDSGDCVGCLVNDDCPADAPVCDPDGNNCVECFLDEHCPAALPVCNGDECVECNDNGDCDMGFECHGHSCEMP
jgi:hypothetical protein